MNLMKRKKKIDFDDWEYLLKVAVILYTIILLLVGFVAGYFIYYKEEVYRTPLTYGIKQINKATNDNYECTCTAKSNENEPFNFNSEGLTFFKSYDF